MTDVKKTRVLTKTSELVINRKLWSRGQGATLSKMLFNRTQEQRRRHKGALRCCLGFLCLKEGVPRKLLEDRSLPGTGSPIEHIPRSIHFFQTAALINDDTLRSNPGREQDLVSLFAREGITLTFVN